MDSLDMDSYTRTAGHLQHFTLDTLPHFCPVRNREVLKNECLKLRSDPSNRILVCDKAGCTCTPIWLKYSGGNGSGPKEEDGGEKPRGAGRTRKKSKNSAFITRVRQGGKKTKPKNVEDPPKVVEEDENAAAAALADMGLGGIGEIEAEILDPVSEDGGDVGDEVTNPEIDAAVAAAAQDVSGAEKAGKGEKTETEPEPEGVRIEETNRVETSVSASEDDSGMGEEEATKTPPSILEGAVLKKLLVSEVYPNPDQPREFFDPEKLDQLAKNFKRKNQQQPVIVVKTDKGYMLVDGERRWRVAEAKHFKYIFAIILANPDIDIFEASAIANLGREGHTPMEYAKTAAKLIAKLEEVAENGKPLKKGVINERVAEALCMSVQTMLNYLDLLKVASDIQEQISLHSRDKDKGVPSGLAVELGRYIPDHQKQRQLLKRIQNEGMSVDRAKQFIRNQAGPEVRKPGRKRQLSDDYVVFKNSLGITEDRAKLILEMGPLKIIMLFYSRDKKDKAKVLECLDRIMAKFKKLRETVYNEGSIKDVVQESVRKLWEADRPGEGGGTEE
ncbi:MAG: ParB/RepB/Spo0J family partition protein [Patescibacteria group bacterium]|nr:ParB/RepB/Spo0J family partition protein [Patescibacteria group bacterium]MDD5554619.1 ParB/RepB/Spo0J family partition protein [Patescibacteria group bacterium]